MDKVHLVIMDWWGNGDGVHVESVWSSKRKANAEVNTLRKLHPHYAHIYAYTMVVNI